VLTNKSDQFSTPLLNSILAFLLGVAVGTGIASYAYYSNVRPEVQVLAEPRFVASPESLLAPSAVDAKVKISPPFERRQSDPDPKNDVASSPPSVDISLVQTVDGGRTEANPIELPTEQIAESRPLEAAQPRLPQSAQSESASEVDLRSETESSVPQPLTASDTSLLPHERI
jgi:hypothetical protein